MPETFLTERQAIHRALEMEMMQGDHLTIRTKSDYAVKCQFTTLRSTI